MDDTRCPWCGEQLYQDNGKDITTARQFDLALEAHSIDPCPEMAAEQGGHPL